MKILVADILKSQAQTLINTVNCVGIMGKGIALEFKERFPEMFAAYVRRCQRKEVKPGIPYLYKSLLPPQIINFPTKDHWKSVSRLADIERGLQYLLSHYREQEVTSIAIPLGCGNGQLEWKTVGPLIYRHSKQMNIPIELYAPYGTGPKELTVEFLSQEPIASLQRRTVQSAVNPALASHSARSFEVEHYNLDVIISVAYRVESQRGTQFRQHVSDLDREIDRLVYKLYDLTDDEIAIVEGTSSPLTQYSDITMVKVANERLTINKAGDMGRIVTKVSQLMALCDELEAKLRQAEADSEKLMNAAVQHVLASVSETSKTSHARVSA